MILASRKCGPPTETTTKTDEDGFYSVEPQEQASRGSRTQIRSAGEFRQYCGRRTHCLGRSERNAHRARRTAERGRNAAAPCRRCISVRLRRRETRKRHKHGPIKRQPSLRRDTRGLTRRPSNLARSRRLRPGLHGYLLSLCHQGASLSWTIYRRGAIYSQGNGSVHGSPTRVPDSLPNAVSLSGVVRDYGGAPLQGVQVAASNEDWGVVGGTAETSIDGSYSLEVPEGAYRVSVSPHRGEAGLVGVTEQRAEIKGLEMAR